MIHNNHRRTWGRWQLIVRIPLSLSYKVHPATMISLKELDTPASREGWSAWVSRKDYDILGFQQAIGTLLNEGIIKFNNKERSSAL